MGLLLGIFKRQKEFRHFPVWLMHYQRQTIQQARKFQNMVYEEIDSWGKKQKASRECGLND